VFPPVVECHTQLPSQSLKYHPAPVENPTGRHVLGLAGHGTSGFGGADGDGEVATFSSTFRVVPPHVRSTSSAPCQIRTNGRPMDHAGRSSVKFCPPATQKGG